MVLECLENVELCKQLSKRCTITSNTFWLSISFQNLVRWSQINKNSLVDYTYVNKVSKKEKERQLMSYDMMIGYDICERFTIEQFPLHQRMTLTTKIYCSRLYSCGIKISGSIFCHFNKISVKHLLLSSLLTFKHFFLCQSPNQF
jgi:hypothetical protein